MPNLNDKIWIKLLFKLSINNLCNKNKITIIEFIQSFKCSNTGK